MLARFHNAVKLHAGCWEKEGLNNFAQLWILCATQLHYKAKGIYPLCYSGMVVMVVTNHI